MLGYSRAHLNKPLFELGIVFFIPTRRSMRGVVCVTPVDEIRKPQRLRIGPKNVASAAVARGRWRATTVYMGVHEECEPSRHTAMTSAVAHTTAAQVLGVDNAHNNGSLERLPVGPQFSRPSLHVALHH